MKVIYVSYVKLTDTVSRDRYIDYLIERDVAVEYWDISSLVRNKFDEHHTKTTDYLRLPETFSEVEAMVRLPENKDAYYVVMVTYEGFTRIFRILSKYNCRMLRFLWGAMPESPSPKFRRAISLLADPANLPRRFLDKANAIVLKRLRLVKPFDIVFAAGRMLMGSSIYANKVVPINSCDYDYYITAKSEKNRLIDGRYAVFLDTNLAYSSDLEICAWPSVNPLNYFQSLNRFFSLLEAKSGIKVVIAAHPKSDYRDETFQGRAIYRNLTPVLTRDACIVISHTSTSESYAVLNSKPIVYIYTTEMLHLYKHTLLREMFVFANYLDAAIYNIDEITEGDQIVIKEVSVRRYEDYKYSFLTTHESEKTPTQEIFWREIDT